MNGRVIIFLLIVGVIAKVIGILLGGLVYGLITAFLLVASLDREMPWYGRLGISFALLAWVVVGVLLVLRL